MKLHEPRGFSRTSPTQAICQHVEDYAGKTKRAISPEPVDLAILYGLVRSRPYVRTADTKTLRPLVMEATWTSDREERTIYLPVKGPNGLPVHKIKKNGEPGAEETMRVKFVTVTVTVTVGPKSYTLKASNKGPSILDSRTGKRVLPGDAARDLKRVLGQTLGDQAFADLSEVLSEPRDPMIKSTVPRAVPLQSNGPRDTTIRVEGETAEVTLAELTDEVWSTDAGRLSATELFEARIHAEARRARKFNRSVF